MKYLVFLLTEFSFSDEKRWQYNNYLSMFNYAFADVSTLKNNYFFENSGIN